MKPIILKLHRWFALVFALPLLVVIGTGLFLSVEPSLVVGAAKPGSLTAERLQALIAQHDPSGQARALSYRSYDGTLMLAGRGAGPAIDVATGQPAVRTSALAEAFSTARRLHQSLLLNAGWLVIASSYVMLVLALLGVLLGWPKFAKTLSGWHKGTAWVLLPLVVLSPLTGLFLAYRITFTPPAGPASGEGSPISLIAAVRALGQEHDLSGLVWVRPMRGQTLARIVEQGEFRIYAISSSGSSGGSSANVRLQPRNWPRLWHEGNFAGHVSAGLNVVTSMAMLLLLATGVWIWVRRSLRRRGARRAGPAVA